MTQMKHFQEKILHLATAVRGACTEKENDFGKQNNGLVGWNGFNGSKTFYQQPFVEPFEGIESDEESTTNESELLRAYSESESTEWNAAFSKLRPPPNGSRKRHFQSGLKLTNSSCEKILKIVGSYKENVESEKEWKGYYEFEHEGRERSHQLWHVDEDRHLKSPAGESQMKFSEYPEEIGESYETPIPRSLMNLENWE